MPLKKLPHQGPPTPDVQMTKRRQQLQARRRTLQTISELSTTELPQAGFRLSPDEEEYALLSHDRTLSSTNKRRSLPQYSARPGCVQASVVHIMTAQRLDSCSRSRGLQQPGAGWNARRERARMQAEQALSGTGMRPQQSYSELRSGSMPSKQLSSSSLHSKSSQPYLRSYYSQQQLLQNSRSPTTSPSQRDHQPSPGRPSKHTGPRDYNDAPMPERYSTDSSSHPSSHGSSVRRSRSSSSSQSFTLQDVPPLPTGCAQPTRSYYTAVSSRSNKGYPYQLPGPMYTKGPSETRTSSLPHMHDSHPFGTPLVDQIPDTPNTLLHHRYKTPQQKPRSKSISSRSTAASEHRKHNARASLPSQAARNSIPKPPTLTFDPAPASRTVAQRSRSRSRNQAPKPHHSKSPPSPTHQAQPPPRSPPSRTSLPKWHADAGDAKVDARAKIKERVRRANEMEQLKEKELQAVGLGAEKGARVLGIGLESEEKRRGCFGGLWGRIWGRGLKG